MKKFYIFILSVVGIFFLSFSCLAKEEIYLTELDCSTYGLLPQTNNEALQREKALLEYELLDSSHSGVTRNHVTINYEIKDTSNNEETEEFILPFHELSSYLYSGIKRASVRILGSFETKYFYGGENKQFILNESEFRFTIDSDSNPDFYRISHIIVGAVLTVILFIIPMIIMIILFAHRKEKKGLGLLYLQKFLSYSICFFSLLFLIISENDWIACTVLLSLFGVLTIVNFLQNILKRCRDFGRLILETVCWTMNIYYLVLGEIYAVFVSLWIFNMIDFVFILLKIRKMGIEDKTNSKKYLPVGILYTFENWIIYLYFSITMSISFIVSELLNHIGYFILFFIFIFVFYFVGMIFRQVFFFLKPVREFCKDLNLEVLEEKILKRQALPYVNPETMNYYNILLAQYSIVYSREKAKEYFKKCYLPKTKGYILSYRGMMLRYGLTKEEFDHSYDVLKREFYNNKNALKSFERFYNFWLPYYGTNPNQDIQKVYNYHRKNNEYSNAISLFVLIYYYKNEGETNKVEELKKEFLSKYKVLSLFVEDLNNL